LIGKRHSDLEVKTESMISKYGRQLVAEPLARLAGWLHGIGVTPNAVTYTGFVLTVLSAVLIACGWLRWGGLILLFAALFDMLDGSLARLTQQSSRFGAFLDSTLDRYSEAATFLALAIYYLTVPGSQMQLVLIFLILIGSLMVSYTRARAEALNVECKEGFLQRPERVVLVVAGLLTGWMLPVLWILAIFTNFTALQRIYEVYWRTAQDAASVQPPKMAKPSDR
jgi:CDP-diacylglycerol--glycerol-3-phosphate 3-phosphatidyltransferase